MDRAAECEHCMQEIGDHDNNDIRSAEGLVQDKGWVFLSLLQNEDAECWLQTRDPRLSRGSVCSTSIGHRPGQWNSFAAVELGEEEVGSKLEITEDAAGQYDG